jgi:hypothetical protein
MRSIQHPCRHFETILQSLAGKITLTDLAAETMVSPSDEDLLTVEVVPRIANFLHLVLWGIVLCTSTLKYVPIDLSTTIVPSPDRWSRLIVETWSNSRWSAVCIITTGGRQPEPASTLGRQPTLGGEPRAGPMPRLTQMGGAFREPTAKVETDTHRTALAAAFSTTTGFLPPTTALGGHHHTLVDLASSNGHPRFMDSMTSKLRVWPIWKELEHFAVSGACEDSSTSTRADEFCRGLSRDLARNCTIAKEIWLFNQLRVPGLRAIAASEAALAHLIIIFRSSCRNPA